MRLTDKDIAEINSQVDQCNEGIFIQPNDIPIHIKEHVIYTRWETGGVSGGSCWSSSNPQSYENKDKPKFSVLDLVLKKIQPEITYLKYKEVEKLIKVESRTKHEYYGNCTDYEVEYIILSELYKLLGI